MFRDLGMLGHVQYLTLRANLRIGLRIERRQAIAPR